MHLQSLARQRAARNLVLNFVVLTQWRADHRLVPSTGTVSLRPFWWAHRDSNPEPKDYAYHFGFRRRPEAVRGLDHAFAVIRVSEC